MSANIENYYKLEVLFSVHERLKSENAKPILHKITRFIFNPNSPESEANSLSEIQDDIIIFSTLLEGYVHSILKNKIKPDSYDTYLKEHNFFSFETKEKLSLILTDDDIFSISYYLINMDAIKCIFEDLIE